MKKFSLRAKSNGYWCSIYLHPITKDIWNLGLIVNKSKRASNDWYAGRKNKRSRRAMRETRRKTLKELRMCYILLGRVYFEFPESIHILIKNDSKKAQNLSKYVERLGFVPVPRGGQLYWALTAQQRTEAIHYCEHTMRINEKKDDPESSTAYE
jgi:hypothetical protein